MGSKRKLDGLGRRVVRIIESDDLVTAISIDAIGGTVEHQKKSIHHAAKAVASECLVIEGAMLESLKHLDVFARLFQSGDKSPENQSFYRSLCENLNRLERVALVIYQAEKMDRPALSMLARISRFAKSNKLLLRIILVGDIAELSKVSISSGIRVDAFIPRKMADVMTDASVKHHFSVSQFTQVVNS